MPDHGSAGAWDLLDSGGHKALAADGLGKSSKVGPAHTADGHLQSEAADATKLSEQAPQRTRANFIAMRVSQHGLATSLPYGLDCVLQRGPSHWPVTGLASTEPVVKSVFNVFCEAASQQKSRQM